MKRCYKKLRGKLAELDMTQAELAHLIRISRSAIADRFRGARDWTLAECYAVLDAVGVDSQKIGEYFPKEAI